jgi:hypothetical protein
MLLIFNTVAGTGTGKFSVTDPSANKHNPGCLDVGFFLVTVWRED